MKAGDTILFLGGHAGDDHLWAIISDHTKDPDRHVAVRFLSVYEGCDESCVLHAGDHAFIRHDFNAREMTEKQLAFLLANKMIAPKAPLSAAVLSKIRNCLLDAEVRQEFCVFLGKQGVIKYP